MKKTYIATGRITGLEPPKKDRDGNVLGEHTLNAGDEYSMDDAAAQPYIAGGSLVLKGSPAAADPAAKDDDLDDKGGGGKGGK